MIEALRFVRTRFKTGCITINLSANAIGSIGGQSLYVGEVTVLFDTSPSRQQSFSESLTHASIG
jgi:hypothetical protein